MERREQAFGFAGFALEKELDDLLTCAPGERMVKLLQRGANDLRSRRFGVSSFTQKINEAVDPLGIAGVEANGSNALARASIGRVA